MNKKRKKILFVVESMGGGVFTFLVGLCNELVTDYDIYVAYGVRRQTPDNFSKYFDDKVLKKGEFINEFKLIKNIWRILLF